MNLPKIRASFAAIAAAIAYLITPSASAAILATNNFETARDGFTVDIGDIDEAAAITNYGTYPSRTAPYPFSGMESDGFGSKYLAVDTGDATLYREFAAQRSSTYLDAYMQFEPTTGEISYTNVAKIVVYLDAATSNLCVISGTSAGDRTPVTNRLDTAAAGSATVVPGTWGRLTINAVKTSSDSVFKFNVLLNGNTLSVGGADTFYSLTYSNAVSRVGFKGTGALDDLVARTSDPFGTAAKIGEETYGSLEQALDEANGATVTLTADHADTVAVTKSGTYKVDKGSYTFGGVAGTDGSYVSSPSSGGVETYTVKLLVAVWDGATAAYDFSTLTRTVGDLTYTLNLNSQNTVGGDGAYVQIGPNNAQKAITLTANGAGAFGTNGQVTAIMKCSALNLTDNTYRGLIGLLSDEGGYYSGDNNVKIGIATGWNVSNGAGVYTPYIANGVQNSYSQNATAYTTDAQTICMTYNSASGTCVYRDGSLNASSTGIKYGTWMSPVGIVFGGMDKDGSSRVNAQTGMKIESIAVFSSMLSAEEVAAYTFPSETPMSGAVNVSDINALFGTKSEINVYLADGTTVTGDTTFNASTIHFISDGSFTMTPPAGNTTTFDFSGVSGKPVIKYATLPTVSGSVFTSETVPTWVTDSTKWSGVIYISSGSFTDFTSNAFGNESSVVRLGTVSGWLRAPGNYAFTNSVPVELVGTLTISNGSSANDSNPNRCTVFKKLSGSGTISTDTSANKVVVVIQDASEFTGNIGLNGKLIVFGDAMPSYTDNNKFDGMTGSIWIMEGASVTANPASGNWWAVGGIKVYGELRAPGLGKFGGGTYITTSDNGVFTLINSNNTHDHAVDYARITGTGTLRYADVSGKWRTLSMVNFPTNMVCENNLSEGLILQQASAIHTIGSLSGSGSIRSDWGDGDRNLRILQARDTTYSGVFHSDDRIGTVTVAPGTSSAGTLTLSGTQTASNGLVVESGAKVNITGTWVGAVTVNGTLGGTGTVTGNVTLSDGATLKVNDISDLLSVTGLTISGTVNIDLPEGTAFNTNTKFLTTSSKPTISNGTKFNVTVGGVRKAVKVSAAGDGLKLSLAPIVFVL